MKEDIFNKVRTNAGYVMTYILQVLDGPPQRLVAVSGDEVISLDEGSDTWVGQLFNGGRIEVPDSVFLSVTPDKYQITTFDGRTHKTESVTEKQLEIKLTNATDENGEVKGNIRSIAEKGNEENRVTRRENELK